MNLSKYLKDYVHSELDNDFFYYYFHNSDVVMWRFGIDDRIESMFHHYKNVIKQGLFIIGNYLYFTYKGVKYWTIISSSDEESYYIHKIALRLRRLGCTHIAYECGRLD